MSGYLYYAKFRILVLAITRFQRPVWRIFKIYPSFFFIHLTSFISFNFCFISYYAVFYNARSHKNATISLYQHCTRRPQQEDQETISIPKLSMLGAVPWLRRLVAGLSGGPASILGQSMWDLWWTKWHRDRFFSEYFGFPLSISFHWCSITRKNLNKINHLHHRVAQ